MRNKSKVSGPKYDVAMSQSRGRTLSPSQESSEFNLLCSVARVHPEYSQIASALRGKIDWTVLVRLAADHSVRPQLINALQKLDWVGVPVETKRSLLDFLRLHQVRSLFVAGELIRVSDEFTREAIRFATFKGSSLAAGLYGDLAMRECNDIDLIVEEQQIARAEAVLGSLGYASRFGGSLFRGAFFSYQKQYMFVRENPKLAIDLHWDFTRTSVPFPLTPDEIWSDLAKVNIGGQAVPTLERANLALLLAGHGAKEGWRCLSWVVDFARFIERHRDLDWSDVLDRARRKGCGRSVLVGCRLAAQLLGTRLGADILRLMENNVQARRMADALVGRISNGCPMAALDRDFGDLELCENWLQKTRAIRKLIITRTIGDYVSMPLPRPLWRIYHLTRPFRLATKVIINLGLGGKRGRRRTVFSGTSVPPVQAKAPSRICYWEF